MIPSLQKKCCYHFYKINVSICLIKQFYWEAIGTPLLSQGGGEKSKGLHVVWAIKSSSALLRIGGYFGHVCYAQGSFNIAH